MRSQISCEDSNKHKTIMHTSVHVLKGYSLNFNKIRTEGFVIRYKRNFPIEYYSVKSDKVYCNKPLNRHECTHTAEYRIIVK